MEMREGKNFEGCKLSFSVYFNDMKYFYYCTAQLTIFAFLIFMCLSKKRYYLLALESQNHIFRTRFLAKR